MSLLMDALKKAEQEKKEAAKKRENLDDSGFHLQHTNDHATSPEPGTEAEAPAPSTGSEAEQVPAPRDVAQMDKAAVNKSPLDLSLEPYESSSEADSGEDHRERDAVPSIDLEEEPVYDGDVTQTIEQPVFEDVSASEKNEIEKTDEYQRPEIALEPEAPADLDQTFHGINLEDTLQGEPYKPGDTQKSFDETLPGIPAALLAADIGGQDQPTPVAAQTIFTATGSTMRPSAAFRWLLVSLAILAVGSAAVFYYFSVTPVQRDIPSPIVARGVETIIASTPVINVAPTSPVSQQPPGPQENQAAVQDTGSAMDEPVDALSEDRTLGNAQGENQTGTIDGAIEDEELAGQSSPDLAPPAVNEAPGDSEFGLADNERLPEIIEPPSSLVKISRSRGKEDENRVVQAAFSAFKAGDYDLAETRYRQAREQLPDNRDVMLGLAAVASKQGRTGEAVSLYIELLRRDPLDNIARAAILGYQYGNNTIESISVIKNMLYSSPDQPLLYFTLGKLEASRSNWSQAQQAFFDAHRLDSSNPDYALNLAICLDRLGQRQAALDYYNVAIELAGHNPASFDTDGVRRRISTLDPGN